MRFINNDLKTTFYIWTLILTTVVIVVSCSPVYRILSPGKTRDEGKPSPPDLSGCTRIEIEYLPSTLEYFFPGKDSYKFFSPEELHYIKTLDGHTVDDLDVIKGFAHDMSRAVYDGPGQHSLAIANATSIHCYRDDEEVCAFFTLGGTIIQTRDEDQFELKTERTDWRAMRPLMIQKLRLRVSCASKIYSLSSDFVRGSKMYPKPAEWCDAIKKDLQHIHLSQKYINDHFRCPSKQEDKCNYAMNPNCMRDSPGDVVLLFETKNGWNQHGGPDLFTLNNHDPKGGFILLNNRTVKFIRNKDELKQFRWK